MLLILRLAYTRSWRNRSRDGAFKGGAVQILKIIANDFILDTDYWENKSIVRNTRTLSVGLTAHVDHVVTYYLLL